MWSKLFRLWFLLSWLHTNWTVNTKISSAGARCYPYLFMCSKRAIEFLIDAVSAVSLLLGPLSLTGGSQSFMPHISAYTLGVCVWFFVPWVCNIETINLGPDTPIKYCLSAEKKTQCSVVCVCLCAWKHALQLLWPVIGAHTYHLSVWLKLQNRGSIRKFPCSALSAR